IKCPGCGNSIAVPGKGTAIKKGGPMRKGRNPADEDDDDADEPAKKSSMGLILGMVGCVVLLLCLVFPAGGGVGVWYFFIREKAVAADGPQAKADEQKRDDTKKDDAPPAPKDIKVVLANPRIDRFGDQIQASVDFEAADPKVNDLVAVMLGFPSAASCTELFQAAH